MNSADEIERLRAKVERLNDEADYLAIVLMLITNRFDNFTPQEAATLLNMVKKTMAAPLFGTGATPHVWQ